MSKIQMYQGYQVDAPVPKPAELVQPNIVTVQDGVPLKFEGSDVVNVRVLHPVNPKAPSKNFSVSMLYVPPHAILKVGSHYNEECYAILKGRGSMTLARKQVEVRAGMFIHLTSWCEHGVENTGEETLEILVCTSPPNP
jgi:mannose-6-phosphate isomerase-like protein (cupin superfamily)